jgi:mRNA interferase MazF
MARPPFVPDRGDFMRVVLMPLAGHEQGGERPVLVLSGRDFNAATGLAFAAPVTSRVRGWPFEVPIPPEGRVQGVVLADQTRSLDYAARHGRRMGAAPDAVVQAVLERLALILGISG